MYTKPGASILILLLVLVALIPAIAFTYFYFRSSLALSNLNSITELTSGSITAALKEFKYTDKDGKEIRYWGFEVVNKTKVKLYDCYFILTSKGDEEKYFGYRTDYVLSDCNRQSALRNNYECRLGNALTKIRFSNSSKIWKDFPPASNLVIAVSRFYQNQTIASEGFYAGHKLADIGSLTPVCLDQSGKQTKQVIAF